MNGDAEAMVAALPELVQAAIEVVTSMVPLPGDTIELTETKVLAAYNKLCDEAIKYTEKLLVDVLPKITEDGRPVTAENKAAIYRVLKLLDAMRKS